MSENDNQAAVDTAAESHDASQSVTSITDAPKPAAAESDGTNNSAAAENTSEPTPGTRESFLHKLFRELDELFHSHLGAHSHPLPSDSTELASKVDALKNDVKAAIDKHTS